MLHFGAPVSVKRWLICCEILPKSFIFFSYVDFFCVSGLSCCAVAGGVASAGLNVCVYVFECVYVCVWVKQVLWRVFFLCRCCCCCGGCVLGTVVDFLVCHPSPRSPVRSSWSTNQCEAKVPSASTSGKMAGSPQHQCQCFLFVHFFLIFEINVFSKM